jgi:hypothetical protein
MIGKPIGTSASDYRAPTLPIGVVPIPTDPTPVTPSPNPDPDPEPAAPPAPVYGIENCMGDLENCANTNLPSGVATLYNVDMRNSVINGMNLCGPVVDKCVNDAVRLDGVKAYYAKNDVWIDFNSRVIQPQYYVHVMSKTGLTPNQAENTCWLLDKNVYGSAFAAVGGNNNVTTEYNQTVAAYNNQGGDKSNPMGQMVNKKGAVDAQRGHYARWDATTGECLVRVAAYNKDELITNDWFHGAMGDKKPAEKWVNAGTAFTCKKEMFEFNLMNDTSTAAMWAGIATVGGATLGAGIGAAAGSQGGERKPEVKDLESGDVTKKAVAWTAGSGAGAGAGIGAGVGLVGGGVAVAITAFVESNNIKCRIGDGLDSVQFGKSGKVKSLRDYHVEWNLRLPDTVMPQQTVTECNSWNTACGSIVNIYDCGQAAVTYKPVNSAKSTQVEYACEISGSTCVANSPVARSYGACN